MIPVECHEVESGDILCDPLDKWDAFISQARERMEQGRIEYGDRSFSRDPDALLAEIQQEALDLCNWGFVAWHRVERMRAALRMAALTRDTEPSPAPER